MQGIWTTRTYTPLARPALYAGQEFLTEREAAELTALLSAADVDPLVAGIFGASDEERRKRVKHNDPTHYDNAMWLATPDRKPLSSNRTSLIYDPPDGQIPPVTLDARQRTAARRALAGFDGYENRPLQERCIIWSHEGPPMLPAPYNDVLQIIQTPATYRRAGHRAVRCHSDHGGRMGHSRGPRPPLQRSGHRLLRIQRKRKDAAPLIPGHHCDVLLAIELVADRRGDAADIICDSHSVLPLSGSSAKNFPVELPTKIN